jgi:homoserine dehydrogenase
MKPIKVGLLGVGNVGGGTFDVLQRNQEEIRRRAGRGIEVVAVSARNLERAKARTGGKVAWWPTRWTSSTTRKSISSSS